jgi:phosphoserine phosphatase RsbU/P
MSAVERVPFARGFAVAAECRPAEEVAGDFFVVTPRGSDRVMVVLGDACGRGRDGAALLPNVLPRVRELSKAGKSPRELLVELNRLACRALPLDRFVTAVAAEIDGALCTLSVANAGHVPLLLRSASGHVRVVGRASGPPLGIREHCRYAEERTPVEHGETIVMMTDGLLEAVEPDLLGMSTVLALLANAPRGARAVERWFLSAVDRAPVPRVRDDITVVCLEVANAVSGVTSELKRAS